VFPRESRALVREAQFSLLFPGGLVELNNRNKKSPIEQERFKANRKKHLHTRESIIVASSVRQVTIDSGFLVPRTRLLYSSHARPFSPYRAKPRDAANQEVPQHCEHGTASLQRPETHHGACRDGGESPRIFLVCIGPQLRSPGACHVSRAIARKFKEASPISFALRPPHTHRDATQPPSPPRVITTTHHSSTTRSLYRTLLLDEIFRDCSHFLRVDTRSCNL
jgi:hypothetical protein